MGRVRNGGHTERGLEDKACPGELHVSMSYVFFSRMSSMHQLYAQ
jgi:hypothetical protein